MNLKLNGVFRPKFFELFKKGQYSKQTFVSDLIAGVIVAVIALPLAIAFAIASGVSPEQGLITAIIAGFIVSFFGGSNFLIGGPTGAFIIIIVGVVQGYGIGGLMIATMLAGFFLIVMGFCRMGAIFRFIPFPIVVGFTSGIALTIFTTQVKDFLGFTSDLPSGFIPQWQFYFTHLDEVAGNLPEAALSILCLLVIISWSKVSKKIPGSLIALIVGTGISLLCAYFGWFEFATIGSKFPELGGGMSLPSLQLPKVDPEVGLFNTLKGLVSPAFTIALLCAIESLMAAMVADGATGKKHNSNTELIGQGIANMVTPLFGGIPATGALARTMASINNGGKTPVTGIVHALVLLLIYLFLMPYVVYVPLGCLAAILVMVAYNMSEWRSFKYLLKGDKSDVAVLLLTFFLTVVVDLTVAIEVGVVMAIILFVKRVMETSSIEVLDEDRIMATEDEGNVNPEDTEYLTIPDGVEVYEINGPFFFGLASRFEEFEESRTGVKVRIIRMRKVPFIDSTGVKNLRNLCERTSRRGVQVILSGVTEKVHQSLMKFGVDKEIGEENIFPHISYALKRAEEIISEK